ncbi:MAG: MBL fold metallo-hydrolase [Acidobacteriota bacterium]
MMDSLVSLFHPSSPGIIRPDCYILVEMRVCVLGSGSGGNSTLVATGKTCLLVDVGFGGRSLQRRLKESGLEHLRIDAVLVTHSHSDHSRGVLAFAGQQKIPVFMTPGTRSGTTELSQVDRWEEVEVGVPFQVGDVAVEAFAVSHDALQPVGFRFSGGGIQGAQAIDLGELSPDVASKLTECDWLILESNHDEEMLKIGPYPWHLKQRVLSRTGHLSNGAVGQFLTRIFDGRARHIFLAHLSRQNNDPDIALENARQALRRRSRDLFDSWLVHLTRQSQPSIVLDL